MAKYLLQENENITMQNVDARKYCKAAIDGHMMNAYVDMCADMKTEYDVLECCVRYENDNKIMCDVARVSKETKRLSVSKQFVHIFKMQVSNYLRKQMLQNFLAFYIIVNELDSCDLNTALSNIACEY